ncbi:MAG: YlxR family protein [Chloroflexota bacterium]
MNKQPNGQTTQQAPKQAGKQKHIPQRTCIVCRQTSAKRALVRLVRTVDQGVQVDPTGKRSGRGAYLCDQLTCWQRAVQSDVLEKALRTPLTGEDRERLGQAMSQMFDAQK